MTMTDEETVVEENSSGDPVVTDEGNAPAAAQDGTPTSWRDALPQEIRENPNFTKYSSIESFSKGHLNLVSTLGKKPELKIPENADERSDFFNTLGRPASAKGYEFDEFEVNDTLKEYVDGRMNSFRELAHANGLTADQAKNVHAWYMQGNAENTEAMERSVAETKQTADDVLRKEWGQAYESKVQTAQRALGEFGSPELVEYLEQTRLGDNPSIIKTFAAVGESLMEDKGLVGQPSGPTPAQVDSQIGTIMANPAYWDERSPERPGLVKTMQDLMLQKHPETVNN